MLLIHSHLNLTDPNSAMLWAAFSTACFGFLHVSELTTPPSGFDPCVHLSISDLAVACFFLSRLPRQTPSARASGCFFLKLVACSAHLPASQPTCIAAVICLFHCSSLQTGNPSPIFTLQTASALSSRRPVSRATSRAIVFGSALPLQLMPQASRTH